MTQFGAIRFNIVSVIDRSSDWPVPIIDHNRWLQSIFKEWTKDKDFKKINDV